MLTLFPPLQKHGQLHGKTVYIPGKESTDTRMHGHNTTTQNRKTIQNRKRNEDMKSNQTTQKHGQL